MKNTHLQHPEDSILAGDLSVLDWFSDSNFVDLSVKIDGCPAIVWGIDPANGEFFVGTKSVFNKKKIKINHSHAEIDINHSGEVALILHACFANLPRINYICQGDFIGFGGDDTYTPNTITYVFDEIIEQTIIVAPHTLYTAENDLRDAIARPLDITFLAFGPKGGDTCKFVMPRCWQLDEDYSLKLHFARQMSTTCEFLTDKQSRQVQQQLNSVIRAGLDIDDITLEALAFANQIDVNVLRLWKLVESIKMQMLSLCRNNGPKAYIGNRQCGGEGYVRTNNYGMFKLVDRMQFSHANFNNGKFACAG
jgi:hypothetical protein